MTSLNKKYIVGLTGGIGSGKTTIAEKFTHHGINYIDADDVAREVVAVGSKCLNSILVRYGEGILLDDGQLNRPKLRQIIFQDPEEKKWLEQLTHPIIHERIIEHLIASTSAYTLLVHPLLFETEKNTICDYTLAINVSKETQVERVCRRDNVGEDMANAIIQSQLTAQARCEFADETIENTGSTEELDIKITQLHEKLSHLAYAKKL